MSENIRIIEHIDNLEQDFRMLDNIFKYINMYWKGQGAIAVQDMYCNIQKDIEDVRKNLLKYRENFNEKM